MTGEQLTMASFTVVLVNQQRYCANELSISLTQPGWESVITFICSGVRMSFPAKAVEKIELGRNRQFCDHCDQRLPNNVITEIAAVT